ncbi:MAG: hypothetical protein ABJB16_08005 [Saprospiraceae bacterium]
MSLDELQRHLDKIAKEHNQKGIPEFEGYSPEEMALLLYEPLSKDCLVQFNVLQPEEYIQIPILNQAQFILQQIHQQGKIKLTPKGYMPVKLVKDIYDQGFMQEEFVEKGLQKLYSETTSYTMLLSHMLLDAARLTKKQNHWWSLTKQGEKLLEDPGGLLHALMIGFGQKLNWSFFDGYGEGPIGQLGWAFSLFLLHTYGDVERPDTYYAEKYFRAFPDLVQFIAPSYLRTAEENAYSGYSIRTFERFLAHFNLVHIQKGKKWDDPDIISKTPLLDALVRVRK